MRRLRLTLVSEGASDAALLPIIEWAVHQTLPDVPVDLNRADFGLTRRPDDGAERLRIALEYFPCDLLVRHRDANGAGFDARLDEIRRNAREAALDVPVVPVVPIRETEAWLLVDEQAIRDAAGFPRGRRDLNLPPIRSIETIADPKARLLSASLAASERVGRKRRDYHPTADRTRIPSGAFPFERLRLLAAFRRFEQELEAAIMELSL